jgi:hypothetical protein
MKDPEAADSGAASKGPSSQDTLGIFLTVNQDYECPRFLTMASLCPTQHNWPLFEGQAPKVTTPL